jgi:hypothetical protein
LKSMRRVSERKKFATLYEDAAYPLTRPTR